MSVENVSATVRRQGRDYLQAWSALGNILRDGGSWSGYERNCFFLNTTTGRYADASAVVGLNQLADSRAVATVDWDHDGDLDLWVSNRTAPRARFLENKLSGDRRFLAIRLQGTKSNRDAIGARVTVEMKLGEQTFVDRKTLRAGSGYLAQSSKWLHFGLGLGELSSVSVRWPNGESQEIAGVRPGQRYLIVQGSSAEAVETRAPINLDTREIAVPEPSPNIRLVPHRRLPIPSLTLIDGANQRFTLAKPANEYQLLTLWASWCAPCLKELQDFDKERTKLTSNGISWIPINLDDIETKPTLRIAHAKSTSARLGIEAPIALATQQSVECLDTIQKVITAKHDDLPLPCSFLVDKQGQLVCVYKGAVSVADIVLDSRRFGRTLNDPREHAIPFAGSWGTNPFPPDLMSVPTQLMKIARWSDALDYMVQHLPTSDFKPPLDGDVLGSTYMTLGRELAKSRDLSSAEKALQMAATVRTDPLAHLALADIYSAQGRVRDSMDQHRLVLKISPGQPMSLNNLAWMLASTADQGLRDPETALRLAQQLCERTNFNEYMSLDTYAVALAANGRFKDAISQSEKAIQMATAANKSTARMKQRLELFKNSKAYVDSP